MIGIVAGADILIPLGPHFVIQTVTSPGLCGVESDAALFFPTRSSAMAVTVKLDGVFRITRAYAADPGSGTSGNHAYANATPTRPGILREIVVS